MELLMVKPKVKSVSYDEVNNVEIFEISPLEAGQAGGVFGNALRTTLMSCIPGYAVTNFQIGYRKAKSEEFLMSAHAFDTIPGVLQDLTTIFLSIKDSLFRLHGLKEKDLTLEKKGPCVVRLGDFVAEGVDIINPELELFEILEKDVEVRIVLKVKEGRGYKDEAFYDMEDWISVDGLFSPVVNVMPECLDMRVNGESGYQKLKLHLQTNKKLTPKECLDVAIKIINEGYNVLSLGVESVIENEGIYFDVQEEEVKQVVYKSLEELGLSVRAFNALKAYGIHNTGDFEKYTEKQIKDIANLGKRTFDELKKVLVEHNIELKRGK